MKNKIYITNLFKKHLDVQCTPDEIKELFKLISRRENEELLKSLIEIELGKDTRKPINAEREEKAITKIKSVLLGEIRAQIPQKSNKPKYPHKSANNWLKIAALWLAIGSATLFLVHRHFTDRYSAQIKNSTKQLVTRNGQRKFIQLFDGTKIWLSPSSTLQYQDQLVNNFRDVTLDGEAFFEVAKDKAHPFIIHSGRMQTEVVGTSFNVSSFSKQKIYNVTVVTGIVKVSMLSAEKEQLSEVVLKPMQQAAFDNERTILAKKPVPTLDPILKKREGILSYDGTAVSEVIADFNRYFNVHIELENKSAACLCYGEFDINKPINTVLSQLAAAIDATVRQTGKGYFIAGGCTAK